MVYHELFSAINGVTKTLTFLYVNDPAIKDHRTTMKLIVYYLLNIHYLMFWIGYLVRYNRHKSLGFINLIE